MHVDNVRSTRIFYRCGRRRTTVYWKGIRSPMSLPAREYRCAHCNKLLCKGVLVEGELEVKCKGCRELTVLKAHHTNALICLKASCVNRISFDAAPPTEPPS